MSLDPQIAAILDMLTSHEMPPWESLSPELLRTLSKAPPPENPEPVAAVRDQYIPGPAGDLPVRIYHPDSDTSLPLLVFFHGGGFVLCDLDTHDGLARALCNALPAVVVSVDYRLAPEHKFPAAVEDAYAAVCWAAEHAEELGADPKRLIVGGDSAGGNLAAVACQLAKQQAGPSIAHQMLLYPVCDADLEREAFQRLGKGYYLETEMMGWFWNHYLNSPAEKADPRVCPLKTEDLSGLPSATVITAEYDPLHEEGHEYAQRLAAAGVTVFHRQYPGAIHGFMSFIGNADISTRALTEAVNAVRQALPQ